MEDAIPTRRSPGLAEAGELLVIDTEGASLRDQIAGSVAHRAWEYFAAVARENPLGSSR